MNRPADPLRYASVCSGIEAVTVAWQPLGLAPAWFAEIDPFANAVLAHHYPHVPNLGDMRSIAAGYQTTTRWCPTAAVPPPMVPGIKPLATAWRFRA